MKPWKYLFESYTDRKLAALLREMNSRWDENDLEQLWALAKRSGQYLIVRFPDASDLLPPQHYGYVVGVSKTTPISFEWIPEIDDPDEAIPQHRVYIKLMHPRMGRHHAASGRIGSWWIIDEIKLLKGRFDVEQQ